MNPDIERLQAVLRRARSEVAKIIIGQAEVVEHALIAIFTGNHALIEGVPGVAKTLLVRTLAKTLCCDYSRIQFTPDLMPSDLTGTNVFNLKTAEFHLIRGPIFHSFILADEINRAPAKTQALEQPGRGLGQDQSQSIMQAEVLQVAVRSIIVGVGVSVLVAVADLSFREGVSYRPILFGLVGVVVAGCVQALLRVVKSSS